jgi:AraC-like DNA-binding protein
VKNRLHFRRLIISYAAILLFIIIVLNMIFYTILIPQYEKELEKMNELSLANIGSVFDMFLTSRIRTLYMDIISDQQGRYLRHIEVDPRGELWEIQDVHENLRLLYSDHKDILSSLAIYYPAQDFINASYGFKSLREDDVANDFNFFWLEDDTKEGRDRLFTSREITDYLRPHQTKQVIVWKKMFPYVTNDRFHEAAIVFSLKEEFFTTVLSRFIDVDSFNGSFFLTNTEGETLFSSSEEKLAELDLKTISAKALHSGRTMYHSAVGHNVVSAMLSDDGQLQYIFVVPTSEFYLRSKQILDRIVLLSVVMLALTLLIIYFVTRINYKPITDIVRSGQQVLDGLKLPPVRQPSSDDYERIVGTLTILGDFVQQNLSIVQRSFFVELLENRFDPRYVKQKLAYLDINFVGVNFSVVTITYFDELEGKFPSGSGFSDWLLGVLHEMQDSELFLYGTRKGPKRIVCLANFQDDKKALAVAEKLISECNRLNGLGEQIGLRVTVGNTYKQIDDIHRSYQESKDLMPYYYLYEQPLLFASVHLAKETSVDQVKAYVQAYQSILYEGDTRHLESFMDEVLLSLRTSRISAFQAHHTIEALSECLQQNRIRIWLPKPKKHEDVANEIQKATTLSGALSLLKCQTEVYFNQRKEMQDNVYDDAIFKVLSYIDEHIDETFSLRDLSDRFHISYSHISSLLKKTVGCSFPSYVTEKKMAFAVQKLLHTSKTVEQIAHEVGFSDTGYFIKLFKKHTGQTPKIYRLQNSDLQ